MLFTTSWDDGYLADRRVASLLERYGMTGTFYLCPRTQHGARMLTTADIQAIAAHHEIGAHTLTHPHLTELPPALCKQEIVDSKAWAEDVSGNACEMFCYPYGDWNDAVRHMVKEAGFAGARTTRDLEHTPDDAYALPTTVQVQPFPVRGQWKQWWHPLDPLGPLRVRARRLRKLRIPLRSLKSWQHLARALFERGRAKNVHHFHLWGHSRELDKYHLWNDLEFFLKFVSEQPGMRYVRNIDLIR